MQENYEIFIEITDCWFTILVLLFVLEIFKKKKKKKGLKINKQKKKTSENDKLTLIRVRTCLKST